MSFNKGFLWVSRSCSHPCCKRRLAFCISAKLFYDLVISKVDFLWFVLVYNVLRTDLWGMSHTLINTLVSPFFNVAISPHSKLFFQAGYPGVTCVSVMGWGLRGCQPFRSDSALWGSSAPWFLPLHLPCVSERPCAYLLLLLDRGLLRWKGQTLLLLLTHLSVDSFLTWLIVSTW